MIHNIRFSSCSIRESLLGSYDFKKLGIWLVTRVLAGISNVNKPPCLFIILGWRGWMVPANFKYKQGAVLVYSFG